MKMEKKVILYQPWGGLGDNLVFSTLPKLYHENGYDFYISQKNTYRNPQICDLVWRLNPYVTGISNEEPNIGSNKYKKLHTSKSIVYNIESSHEFAPINETPKVYYNPKVIDYLKDKIIIDNSCVSGNLFPMDLISDILEIKDLEKQIMVPNFKYNIDELHKKEKNDIYKNVIDVDSIFDYCDIINSCYFFICSFSGQSVLASALNKKNTICILPNEKKYSDYLFPNLNYHFV